jgi:uncharacterized membrane protein YqjE
VAQANERMTQEVYRGDGTRVGDGTQKSAGQLMKEVTEDLSTLVRKEIELAKQELGESVAAKVKGAALIAIAGVMGFFALIFALLAIRDALNLLVPEWAADLITMGALLLIGVIGIVVAKGKLATPVSAEMTKQTIKEDVEWAKTLGRR